MVPTVWKDTTTVRATIASMTAWYSLVRKPDTSVCSALKQSKREGLRKRNAAKSENPCRRELNDDVPPCDPQQLTEEHSHQVPRERMGPGDDDHAEGKHADEEETDRRVVGEV
jgi:hypothetical protein